MGEEETEHPRLNTLTSSNNKRLTRSTYVGEPISCDGTPDRRRKRSDSTDSENGWIPPPPLLPLETEIFITNSKPRIVRSGQLKPSSSTSSSPPIIGSKKEIDPISSSFAIAHLKCTPSNPPRQLSEDNGLFNRMGFRLLGENELLKIRTSNKNRLTRNAKRATKTGSQVQALQSDSSFQSEANQFSRRHRQSELLEKRSKRLEKEKLLHARFKLKAHLELLIHGSGSEWKSVRSLSLKRIKEDELIERTRLKGSTSNENVNGIDVANTNETENEKVERVRQVMIKETEETLKRYEKLLDTQKVTKPKNGTTPQNNNNTNHLKASSQPGLLNNRPPQPKQSPKRVTPKPLGNNKRFHSSNNNEESSQSSVEKLANNPKTDNRYSKQHFLNSSSKNNDWSSSKKPGPSNLNPNRSRTQSRNVSKGIRSTKEEGEGEALPNRRARTGSVSSDSKSQVQNQSITATKPQKVQRESLYDSQSIRRLAMDDQINNGQRRVGGRSSFALGCKVPDFQLFRFDHRSRLQSMSLDQSSESFSNPFDRPGRMIFHNDAGDDRKEEQKERGDGDGQVEKRQEGLMGRLIVEEEGEDWIEFNPTVNEEKRIIEHEGIFGNGSKFFEIDAELRYLEELDLEDGSGKSIRMMISERMSPK